MFSESEASEEVQIRQFAYDLWQCEGRPENRNLLHWFKAEAMLREDKDLSGLMHESEGGAK